jgi:hypothetical protein
MLLLYVYTSMAAEAFILVMRIMGPQSHNRPVYLSESLTVKYLMYHTEK